MRRTARPAHPTHSYRHARSALRVRASTTPADAPARRALVIGGGWAGFGAARALQQAGADVTLLDAAPSPGGLAAAWRSAGGKTVEPGIKGFWYQYANITSLVDSLGIRNAFTEYTRSSFYTPAGLQVRSPIFQQQPRLPSPLGSFLYTAPYFTSLPLADRVSALPLLGPLLEYDADAATYEAYDRISALELFRSAGVSARLYKEFLEPMLLVTLFAPGYKLSAAAALDALYYFALAHQPDFDTRWCRGSVSERILAPFAQSLIDGGASLLGGRTALEVLEAPQPGRPGRVAVSAPGGGREVWEAEAVVLAVGVGAMQRLVAASAPLASQPFFAGLSDLGTVDVMAARLWLDRRCRTATPSNVLVGFERDVGSTLFNLSELQDDFRSEPAVEVDWYHAASLLPLPEEEVVRRVVGDMLPVVDPGTRPRVLDSSVLRFRGAVTLFAPGCAAHMPTTTTPLGGVFVAGDHVRQGPGSHGAKGLCQEKALATGLQAGNAAASWLGLQPRAVVLDPEPDETHIAAGKEAARQLRALLGRLPPSPLPTPLDGWWR